MAWARAFYALAQGLEPGDRILTGIIEYGANYVAMLQVKGSIASGVVHHTQRWAVVTALWRL